MNYKVIFVIAIIWCGGAIAMAQQVPVKNTWVPVGRSGYFGAVDGVVWEPAVPNPKSRIALLYTHIGGNNFTHPSGPELSRRGYRVLLLNHFGNPIGFDGIAPSIAEGVKYLRNLPGVEKVVLLAHSGGGPLMSFYQNVAENGPRACQGPQKIYPCDGKNLNGLPKADGLVMLDPIAGMGVAELLQIDPAITDESQPTKRDPKLDIFDLRNGFDPKTNGGAYSESFMKVFFAAQAAQEAKRVEGALARLKAIQAGNGLYKDDEPFTVVGPGGGVGPRILMSDVKLLSRTKAPHLLLKSDGTVATQIVKSVRLPGATASGTASGGAADFGRYQPPTSVRRYLANSAVRTTADYVLTEDSISGIDWASSSTSTPANVEGITVPLLIMPMSCHYWVVTNEIVFDHAASKDKQYVAVEGAAHIFTPCRPEYGDTVNKLFDYVDTWLSEPGRFLPGSK
jgi:pimeloyl-ACP methyl ester carboxylesterase